MADEPVKDRHKAAIKVSRQQEMSNDERTRIPAIDREECSGDCFDVISGSTKVFGTSGIAKLEIGDESIDIIPQHLKRQRAKIKIGLPNDGGKIACEPHEFANRFEVNARFAADPLNVPCSLGASPSDGFCKEGLRQWFPEGCRGCPFFTDAKAATQIAAGKIEQMRGGDTRFFAVFDSVPKAPCSIIGTTKSGQTTSATTTGT
jgi:hypothetical protein